MKSFVIVAFLLLFAQTIYTFDLFDYQQGFSHQLGLSEEQNDNANRCLGSIEEAVYTTKDLLSRSQQNPTILITGAINLYNRIKPQVISACQPHFFDLVHLALKQSGSTPLMTTITDNYNKHSPYVIQGLTEWLETLSRDHEDFKAGQIQGRLFQILLGIETPEELPHLVVDETKFTPFEFKDFSRQFNEVFYKSLGIKDQETIDLQNQCAMKIYNKTLDLVLLSLESSQWDNLNSRLEGYKIVFDWFLESAKSCSTAFKALEPILAPFKKTFAIAPATALTEIFYQIGLNQPEIAFAKELFDKYVYEGEYKKSGKVAAEILKLVTRNLGW